MKKDIKFDIIVATEAHYQYAEEIVEEMASSAKARGTGIAKRSPDYVRMKMSEGKAVIALTKDGVWAGFCYIEAWQHGKYVANSGLIVSPKFREYGLARKIKDRIFKLSRQKYPDSKIFGLTTGLAVMKINSELGYRPVTYSELTDDEEFWAGCKSCVNYDILMMKDRKNCMCTAMLFVPPQLEKQQKKQQEKKTVKRRRESAVNLKLFARWMRIKQRILLNQIKKSKTNLFIFLLP